MATDPPTPQRKAAADDDDTRTATTVQTADTSASRGAGMAKLARLIGAEPAEAVVRLSAAVHAQKAAQERVSQSKVHRDACDARKEVAKAKRLAHAALRKAGIKSAVVCRGVRVRLGTVAPPKKKPLSPEAVREALLRACTERGIEKEKATEIAESAVASPAQPQAAPHPPDGSAADEKPERTVLTVELLV